VARGWEVFAEYVDTGSAARHEAGRLDELLRDAACAGLKACWSGPFGPGRSPLRELAKHRRDAKSAHVYRNRFGNPSHALAPTTAQTQALRETHDFRARKMARDGACIHGFSR